MSARWRVVLTVGVLLVGVALAGCTRARPEAEATKAAAGSGTAAPTTAGTAPPQPPGAATTASGPQPTSVAFTPGATAVSVAEVTATAAPAPTSASVPSSSTVDYTVQWGDTLSSIAYAYDTTVEAIMALNGLSDPGYIRVGQALKVVGAPGSVSVSPGGDYTVQQGDTLFSIALRYGTTVDAIQRANGIVNVWYIQVGQRLVIPQGSGAPAGPSGSSYVVQPGDTLYGIAALYGRNVWDLIVANNLSDPYWIYVGQVLSIPF